MIENFLARDGSISTSRCHRLYGVLLVLSFPSYTPPCDDWLFPFTRAVVVLHPYAHKVAQVGKQANIVDLFPFFIFFSALFCPFASPRLRCMGSVRRRRNYSAIYRGRTGASSRSTDTVAFPSPGAAPLGRKGLAHSLK